MKGRLLWVAPLLGVIGFLLAWEVLVRLFDVPAFQLPAPSRILAHLADDPAFYLRNAWVTFREAALGLLVAFAVALTLAVAAAHVPALERALHPVVVLIQVTPVIAYAPAVVIWLGAGILPILVLTVLVSFVPFFFNGVAGLLTVDPAALELLHSVKARRREILWRLRLPHAVPYLLAAARIAVGLALIGAVLGEFFALVDEGLGVAIKKAQAFNDVDQLWGSIFTLAALGSLMIGAVDLLGRTVFRWHTEPGTR